MKSKIAFVALLVGMVQPALAMEPVKELQPACLKTVKAEVLKKARQLNEEAQMYGYKVLYGAWLTSFVVLARVTDETEPSDYVVVLRPDHRETGTCKVQFVKSIADGSRADVDDVIELQ